MNHPSVESTPSRASRGLVVTADSLPFTLHSKAVWVWLVSGWVAGVRDCLPLTSYCGVLLYWWCPWAGAFPGGH